MISEVKEKIDKKAKSKKKVTFSVLDKDCDVS